MTVDTAGDELLVNDLIRGTQTTAATETAVAVSDTNRVVVFSGYGLADAAGIYAKLYDANGDVVGDGDTLINSTIAGEQYAASVATDSSGNYVVAWAGRGAGDLDGVFFQRFDANGVRLGNETLVNSTVAGFQGDPSIAMNDDGTFAIGWSGQSAADPTGVYMQRFMADGTHDGDQVLINTTTDNHQTGLAMVFDSTGNLVTAWSSLAQDTSDWGVFGQRFDASGNRLGDEFAWNSTTTESQQDVALAAGLNGEVVAAWQSRGQDGDGWGLVARKLQADGTTFDDEVMLNEVTAGEQLGVKLAIADDGAWIATWASAQANGAGWEVMARTFDDDGTPQGDSLAVNQERSGINSGNQRYASVAVAGETAIVVWSGLGAEDRHGVHMQQYDVELVDDGPQQAPNLAAVPDQTAMIDQELEISLSATDVNPRDTLTFLLDADNSPTGATLEQVDNNSAIVRWTPAVGDENKIFTFRVLVTDDGDPTLADSEEFQVTVGNVPVVLDLNGEAVSGGNLSATYEPLSGAAGVLDPALAISGADDSMISGATATLTTMPNGDAESLSVDLLDTNIAANYESTTGVLTLSGVASVGDYERVLRTLAYSNTSADADGVRTISLAVSDAAETSAAVSLELTIGTLDKVALAQALTAANARFLGAAWCPACTQQKELFEDGGALLPFEEVTDEERMLNDVGTANDVETIPTWLFDGDIRLEGVQSLQVLAAAAGVTMPVGQTPFLAEIPDGTLLVGSPLHVPLDGYDPNGEPLTYTVTTNNPDVVAEMITGNRSMRIDVEGYGDLVFELFEGRAARPTERVIDLAMEGFYDGVSFHRIVDDFVIQGGDPMGDGTGGSDKGNFDDQFHVDLQHNRTGLLSYAKGTLDDSNDSQFFITEGASSSLRNLDFNHSIFGILTEGEANRAAISDIATEAQNPPTNNELSKPVFDVIMNSVDIFTDNENAVVLLRAAEGVTGPVEVTVEVMNSAGNVFERKFTVNVGDDPFNGRPFLGDIAPISTQEDTSVQVQLTSTDVEGDPVVYQAQRIGTVDYTFDITDEGLLTVTPPAGFTGTIEIGVLVSRETPLNGTDLDSQILSIEVLPASMGS